MNVLRTVMWRRLDGPGAEYCTLAAGDPDGWVLAGTTLMLAERGPAVVRYRVVCDAGWRTRLAWVEAEAGAAGRILNLAGDGAGGWRTAGGQPAPALQGCVDVDLGATPATNTLPIRRLGLAVGETREILAAWVRFPGLEVEAAAQRYTRLDENTYRYESVGTGYATQIEVDDLGLVRRYPGGWEREATK